MCARTLPSVPALGLGFVITLPQKADLAPYNLYLKHLEP